ncbi:YceI family protein [Halobacteriovorax sp. HLS]|uniref:YceI family protein n=1 Tax=Halobacteriovorax sp. HLS TaxID=2234000 RepID=UPI000FD8FBCC|nr:YceI family protein [Halobacteriovorax sp. HLS]
MRVIILWTTLLMGLSIQANSVDLSKSDFTWKGTKITGEHFGKISLKEAKIERNKDGSIQSADFVMDMNSIKITDLSGEWADKFISHIKSSDFFNVEKFPEASLKILSVKGDTATANMTIKGKTNTVKFKFLEKGKNIKGVLNFDRTKFDMIYGSGNFFKNLGDKTIHDEVSVQFNVVTR